MRDDYYVRNEWKSLNTYCVNPEVLPRFKDFFEFEKWWKSNHYYGGHTRPFKFIKLDGKFVAIDVEIADVIEKLNKAGYYTKFCCSAHFTGETHYEGYIYFDLDRIKSPEKFNKIMKFQGLKTPWIDFILDRPYELPSGITAVSTIRFYPKYRTRFLSWFYYHNLRRTILKTLEIE